MSKILLVKDNPEILEANRAHFVENGFEVCTAATGGDALSLLMQTEFDCMVLDVMLPDIDGYTVFEKGRELSSAPIIFLTCLDELDDRLKGLERGADDYLTKPYSLRELLARVNNLLRRAVPAAQNRADVFLDEENHLLRTPEKSVFLSAKEHELFAPLFQNPGKIFTRDALQNLVWPSGADAGIVAVYISRLRRKLSFAGAYIGTIESTYGEGYCLKPPGLKGDTKE